MLVFLVSVAISLLVILLGVLLRIYTILPPNRNAFRTSIPASARIVELQSPEKSHVLFVLGSGGHTSEMFSLLADLNPELVTHRTYVFSSGDVHSAKRAREFEERLHGGVGGGGGGGNDRRASNRSIKADSKTGEVEYRLLELPRARRVKQSWLTTPWTCLVSLRECLNAVAGRDVVAMGERSAGRGRGPWKDKEFPDLVVCNGPGTAVMVVLACYIYKFFGACQTKVIYVESFARVKSLSLSGKLLLPLSHRFLVQWPALADKYPKAEHAGFLVS